MQETESAICGFTTRPLQPRFGVEVVGLDLEQASEEELRALGELWAAEPLVLLRRQSIDEDALVGLSRRFGELEALVRDYLHSPRHPEVLYVSNLLTEGGQRLGSLSSGELNWHTDQSYRERPATGAVFHALEVPEGQGRTSWCNMVLAYEALPEQVRAEIAGRAAVMRYNGYERENISAEEKRAMRERHPPVEHPLVLIHPLSGREGLYLDISIAYGIVGMDDARAAELLEQMAAVMTRPEFVYTHEWRPGDVMLWDNGRLCHRRDPFDPDVPRIAKRTTIYLDPARFPVPG